MTLVAKNRKVPHDVLCFANSHCVLYLKAESLEPLTAHTFRVALQASDEQAASFEEKDSGVSAATARYTVLVSKGVVHLKNQKFSNKISYTMVGSGLGGHYITRALSLTDFVPVTDLRVTRHYQGATLDCVLLANEFIEASIVIFKDTDVYQVKSKVINHQKINAGTEVQINVDPELDFRKSFATDSNGLFEVQRTYNDAKGVEQNIYPITSHLWAYDKDKKKGLRIFTDRAQGATLINGFKIWIQRTANREDHKGNTEVLKARQPIETTHVVQNFEESNQEENVALAENVSTSSLIFLSREEAGGAGSRTPNAKLPQAKVFYDVLTLNKFQVRVQNLNREAGQALGIAAFLREAHPGYTFEQVDFDYVTDPLKKGGRGQAVEETVSLKPLEFATFVVTMDKSKGDFGEEEMQALRRIAAGAQPSQETSVILPEAITFI